MNSVSDLLFLLLLVTGTIIFSLLQRLGLNRLRSYTADDSDASLILSVYSVGVKIENVSRGVVLGYSYSMLMTTELPMPVESDNYGTYPLGMPTDVLRHDLPPGQVRSSVGQAILMVELPTQSLVHFAGFSLEDPKFRILLGNTSIDNLLGRVVLEGDFPDYFRLYCDKGKEIELLEILDPPRMAFLIDFCKKCNWELIEDRLYFTQSESMSRGSDVNLVDAAEDFAQKILPTLQRMSQASRLDAANS